MFGFGFGFGLGFGLGSGSSGSGPGSGSVSGIRIGLSVEAPPEGYDLYKKFKIDASG